MKLVRCVRASVCVSRSGSRASLSLAALQHEAEVPCMMTSDVTGGAGAAGS